MQRPVSQFRNPILKSQAPQTAPTSQQPSGTSALNPRRVTWLSVLVNLLLSGGKIITGIAFRSQTILADGLHSMSDLITDGAVLAGLSVSQRPADGAHHYGHRRVSTLVAVFVGAALLAAAAYITYNGVALLHNFIDGRALPPIRPLVPFLMAIVSIPFKEAMFQVTRHVGRRWADSSLLANAWHHRSDAFSSIAAAAGLAGVMFGGPRWQFIDPLMAIVLAAFLVAMALRIIADGASELIDRAPGKATLTGIARAVSQTKGVRSYHAFRARQVGGKVAMDVHVQVDPDLTVRQGHDIATAVRDQVRQADPQVIEVIVHVEPKQADPPYRPPP